jgi:hypothetical protein
VDPALTAQRRIGALHILQVALVVTLFRVGVMVISASVVLQADTLYNFSNSLSSIALWLTFALEQLKLMGQHLLGNCQPEWLRIGAGSFLSPGGLCLNRDL